MADLVVSAETLQHPKALLTVNTISILLVLCVVYGSLHSQHLQIKLLQTKLLPVALAHAHCIVAIADRILNLPVIRAKAKQLGIDLPEPSNASGSHAHSSSAVQAPKYHPGVPARPASRVSV